MAVIRSTLEFIIKEPEKEPYFQIEIMEQNEKTGKGHMIGRETISINKEIANRSHTLTLPTVYGTDAVIGLALELSNSFKDLPSEDRHINLSYKDEIFEEFEKGKEKLHKFDKYNPFKLAPLYNQFVIALSPVVLAKGIIMDFIMWKEPLKTFWYSILLTFGFLFGRFLVGVGFLFFFIFSRRIIPKVVSIQPFEPKPPLVKERKRDIYRRNIAFMRVILFISLKLIIF